MKKRFISILLSLVMIFSLLPVTAAAIGQTPIADPYNTGLKVYSSNGTATKWEKDANDIPVLTLGMDCSVYIDGNNPSSYNLRYVNARIETTTPANTRSNVTLVLDNVHLYYRSNSQKHACIEVGPSTTMNLWLIGASTLGKDEFNAGSGNNCNAIGVYGNTLGESFAGELFIADAPAYGFWYPNNLLGGDVGSLECIAGSSGAAGIGGVQNGGTHGDITIESGFVTVKGDLTGGAGIGGSGGAYGAPGFSTHGGNVTINGGEVYVDSYSGAAAIGGAAGYIGTNGPVAGHGGHVAVNGGVLKARADVTAQVLTGDIDNPYATRTGMVIGAGANLLDVRTTMTNGKYDQSFSVQNAIVTLSANDRVQIYDYFPINVESPAEEAAYLTSHIKNCVFGYERHNNSRAREMQNVNVHGDFRLTQDYTLKEGDAIWIPSNATFTVTRDITLTIAPVTGTEGAYYDPSQQGILLGRANSLILEKGDGTFPAGAVEGYGLRPEIFTLDIPEIDLPEAAPTDAEDMEEENRVKYIAVVEERNGTEKRIEAGNSVAELAPKVGSDNLLTVITAGYRGFEAISDTEYKIDNSALAPVDISLTTNGSLRGTSTRDGAVFTITEENGTVTAEGVNISLASASYTMFSPKDNTGFSIEFPADTDMSSGKLAFTAEFTSTDNNALITIPELFGSSFMLESISPVMDGTALRFGGKLALQTPVVDIAGIEITKLQLDFAGDSVTLGGIEGSGEVNIPKVAGFVGGKAETKINTFVGEGTDEGYFMFEVEVKTPVVDGEFYLDFAEAYGVMLPNSFYMAGKVGTQGIPLVPPTTVAYITGGGLGVYNLAKTISMKRLALPPIRLRMTGSGSIVDVMEGTLDLTAGPGYTKVELSDIEIADTLNVLKKVGTEYNVNLEQLRYRGVTYDVAAMHSKMFIEAGLSLMDYEFLTAYGNVGFDAYAGLSLDINSPEPTAYGIFRLQSAGALGGTLQIPKGILFGLPPWDMTFADVSAAYRLAGTFHPSVDLQDPMSSFTSEKFLDSFSPEGAIAAKVNFNVLLTSLWARVGYIFGGSPTFDGGFGEGPELLTMSLTPLSGESADVPLFSVAEASAKNEGDYSFMQLNSKVLADTSAKDGFVLMSVVGDTPTGVTLTQTDDDEKVYTAKINGANIDPKQIMYVMTAHEGYELAAEDFEIRNSAGIVERITPTHDSDGKQTNTPNFVLYDKDADDDADNNNKPDMAYFTADDHDTYTITCTKPIDIQAVLFAPYATLDKDSTNLTGTAEKTVNYKINDRADGTKYAMQVYLGEDEGGMDYLLAETERNDDNASIPLTSDTGTIEALETKGCLAPDGSYHVTVALMEEVTVPTLDANGEVNGSVTSWVVADKWSTSSKSFTYDYDGATYGTIDSPTFGTAPLTYSGNETMTASWYAVTGADGYIVTVYDGEGNATGVTYQTVAERNEAGTIVEQAPTSVVMALTDETTDSNGNIIPGLAAGVGYKIGVKSFKNVSKTWDLPGDADDVELTSQILSAETMMTTTVDLPEAYPPTLTYTDNVTPAFYTQENIQYVLLVNAQDQTFTVTSDENCTFTVKNVNTNTTLNPATTANSATVTVPAFIGSIQLEIVAAKPSGDYTINYVTVRLDDTAPTLTLNDGGKFFKSDAPANVTGRTEANAIVCAWGSGATTEPTVSTRAASDGTFALQLADAGTFAVEAIDPAKNRSTPVNATVAAGSTVSPEETSFTQYGVGTVSFTLTPKEHASLVALKYNGVSLTENTDYTVSNDVYTLTASFLASIPVGGALFTFEMSNGNAPQALLTVIAGVTPPSCSSDNAPSYNIVLAGQGGNIPAEVEVVNDTARLSFNAQKLDALLADPDLSGDLAIDLTPLTKSVNAAKLMESDWKAISDAVNATGSKLTGFSATMDTGTIHFDGAAMAAAELGGSVTFSINPLDAEKLTTRQALLVGDRPVFDISVLCGNTPLADLKGGSVKVSIPYTLAQNENPDFLVIWYLSEDGKLEAYPCEYADGHLRFTLSHLSVYVAAYFPFTDTFEDQWYYGDAAWAYMAGLISGVGDDHLAPHMSTTRAMVVTLLHRLEEIPAAPSTPSFTDVAADLWYSDAVAWAKESGIIDGYDTTRFGPEDPITREQMATILYRYAQYKNYDVSMGEDTTLLRYNDAFDIAEYAIPAMQWACGAKLIQGSAGALMPQSHAERCQVVAVLHRFRENINK